MLKKGYVYWSTESNLRCVRQIRDDMTLNKTVKWQHYLLNDKIFVRLVTQTSNI